MHIYFHNSEIDIFSSQNHYICNIDCNRRLSKLVNDVKPTRSDSNWTLIINCVYTCHNAKERYFWQDSKFVKVYKVLKIV